jgi:hypothetical protein
MCPSRLTGRTQAAPSRSQATLDIWSQIQNRRRRNNRSGHLSATYNDHPIKTLSDNNQQITARILNAIEIYQHQSMKQQSGELLGVM